MVAATLVGLGIVHPEGHEAFGKAESALLLALNVFLRPGMMIIGFLGASVLSFVCVWLLNKSVLRVSLDVIISWGAIGLGGIFVMPFYLIVYGMLVAMIFQKVFQLTTHVPDKVLLWIGGPAVTFGSEATAGVTEGVRGMAQGGMQSLGSTASSSASERGKLQGQELKEKYDVAQKQGDTSVSGDKGGSSGNPGLQVADTSPPSPPPPPQQQQTGQGTIGGQVNVPPPPKKDN
jgi:defect-in-organelle-trafficking protein DotA